MQYYFIPLKYNSHKINSTYKDENTEFFFFLIYFRAQALSMQASVSVAHRLGYSMVCGIFPD